MKKFLLSTFILVLTAGINMSATAQNENTDNADASATATVLKAMSVAQVQNLAFGDVFQGTNKSVDPSSGSAGQFTVAGTGGEGVTLDFTLPNEGGTSTNNYTYQLDEDGTSTAELEITFAADDASWADDATYDATNEFAPTGTAAATIDNTDDEIYVFIGGTVQPTANQTEGSYTGTITLTSTYN